MQRTSRLMAVVLVGFAFGPAAGLTAAAQTGSDGGLPYVENEASKEERQWENLREAGERACKEAVDSAALLGEQLQGLTRHFSRTLVQVSGELTRGMAQGMDLLAERLDEMAERMERSAE